MFAACPECRIEVFTDESGTCPQCGLVLNEHPTVAPVPETTLLVIETEPPVEVLPEPHFGWAIMSVFLSGVLAIFLSFLLTIGMLIFYPSGAQNYEVMLSLGFAAMSVSMWLMGWSCLQPHPQERLGMRRPRALHVAIACTMPLAIHVVWGGVASYFPGAATSQISLPADIDLSRYLNTHWYSYYVLASQPWLAVFVIGCVLPAISEEIFFRGYLGRGLVARYGVVGGVLLTSLLFGLVHLEPTHVAFTFCFGLLIHATYLCSQSIWPPMLMHGVANAIAFGLTKLEVQQRLPATFMLELNRPWIILSAIMFIVASLWLLWRTRRTWQASDGGAVARSYVAIEPPGGDPPATLRDHRAGPVAWPVALVGLIALTTLTYEFGNRLSSGLAAESTIRHAADAMTAGNHVQALRLCRRAAELSPSDPYAWRLLSYCHAALGHYAESLAAADRSLQLLPTYASAHSARSAALSGMRRYDEALRAAKEALLLAPNDVEALKMVSIAALGMEDYAAAIDACKLGRTVDDKDAFFPAALAQIYAAAAKVEFRQPGMAKYLAEEACRLSANKDPDSLARLAMVLLSEGDLEQAIERLDQAAALGNGLTSTQARYWAEDLREFGPALLELRTRWAPTVTVDDIACYRALKTFVIIVPHGDVGKARTLELGDTPFSDWKHLAMTIHAYDRQTAEFRDQLVQHCDLTQSQAQAVVSRLALTAAEFSTLDDAAIAKTLNVSLAEAAGYKAALASSLDNR